MALSPLTPNDGRVVEATESAEPSKTYRLNLETNVIDGLIDNDEAVHQFVAKALRTARDRFLIYDDQYGCELEALIGDDLTAEYLQMELPRLIRETLIYDDRVTDVVDFDISRLNEQLYVKFRVVTTDDTTINEEVTF